MTESAIQPSDITDELLATYETVIGLEVHCQLLTESKLFAQDRNRFGTEPNTNIGPLTLALPGTLPKINKKAVEYAIRLGLACGCSISRRTIFDRKNYFYPDLPKGYQISQDKKPICENGGITIAIKNAEGKIIEKWIRFHHIHLEEDAGKSVHDGSETETLLDYNRAGTPLVEMVSEPDLRSAEETGAFVTEIRRLVRYLQISDGNMEEGSLRCDVNVSIRKKGEARLGTKVEIKNMNSIRNMMRAISFEEKRQVALLENGAGIQQETRMFDVESGQTYGMRVKETMNDYRYFPDPDLSPVVVSEEWLEKIRESMPALPQQLREKFVNQYGIPAYDAMVLTDTREIAAYFEAVCSETSAFKAASNWLMGPVKSYLNDHGGNIETFPISPEILADLIQLSESGVISNSVATQKIFPVLLEEPERQPSEIASSNNWLQNSNTNELETLITEVMNAMPDKVAAYRKGKKGLLGLFVGEVMKKSNGTADPKLINQMLAEKL
ncbi:Asp-tRNA(Asn)/Glu-tRNA(Gln) amidotransferase subunit GatB [Dyadobacter sediminis]|uniref:Aspartyl/glutamyl-tRNA(Asn/Gln) amidotransferase subunit B n=1 Tax=Dyadobacter sediminis TaxID=1493691 RepID=A0A5R9K7U2_9BACT|nr:Asp-tRNA(Asn)/Glu-tRNA(Gln) amidotransferase subunit GatB [Dyadobacter sediminis]TLU89924.1 Asp-tRNA(Asn)/Glu-tRNA(Gln) amidotransferase subunit GatB [Dyadobacter sediminis]GGC11708.1 aspartyl/glutamyl-tRNA(Asn/Gln) amidotransferase subunit B [Dyadobacter sediminis]